MTRAERRARFKKRRAELMILAYLQEEKTLEVIGQDWGVTREYVRQVLNKHGGFVPGAVRKARKHAEVTAAAKMHYDARDMRSRARYDMSLAEIKALAPGVLRTDRKHPIMVFRYWERNNRNAGYDVNVKFAEWWKLWQDSGCWDKRGRGYGYWMARCDTSKGWYPENIWITTGDQRSSESYIAKPAAERVAKALVTKLKRYGPKLRKKPGGWDERIYTCHCGRKVKSHIGFTQHQKACPPLRDKPMTSMEAVREQLYGKWKGGSK